MAEEMRARARDDDEDDRRRRSTRAPAELEEAARALVALRYYQRFLDEVERRTRRRGR